MSRVLVVGSLNMDITVTVDSFPKLGETIPGKTLNFSCGGKGANQAISIAKLGNEVTLLGCVGQDNSGDTLINNLKESNVDTNHIFKTPSQPTGTAVIGVDNSGDNCIIIIAGANHCCDVEFIKNNDELIKQCDYILLQMEIPLSAVYYTIERAYELDPKFGVKIFQHQA